MNECPVCNRTFIHDRNSVESCCGRQVAVIASGPAMVPIDVKQSGAHGSRFQSAYPHLFLKKNCNCSDAVALMNRWGPEKTKAKSSSVAQMISRKTFANVEYVKRLIEGFGDVSTIDDPPRCLAKPTEPEHVEQITLPPHKPFTGRVGFLSTAYHQCGGTEVWHQTLIPRLGKLVSGFAIPDKAAATGDFGLLGCKHGVGISAAKQLAEDSDTLVVWGLGSRLGEVLADITTRPRVIAVSHCDRRSAWTIDYMREQGRYSNDAVYICPTGIETVPQHLHSRAHLIPNAADPARVTPTRTRAEVRSELGIADDAVMLVTFSRLSEEKRISMLADAVRQLPSRYAFIVAGGTNSTSSRHNIVTSDRVRLIDPVTSPANLLNASDAMLSASIYEGYGLSMAEAMLAGVPVIATPVGLLEYDQTLAHTVPIDATAKDWAAAICQDFDDRSAQRQRADASRRFISTEHSVERFVGSWRSLLTGSHPN